MSSRGLLHAQHSNDSIDSIHQKKVMNRVKENVAKSPGRGTIATQARTTANYEEMHEVNSHGNPMVEDMSFPFGGYWRGTVAQLVIGDGVRFSGDYADPTWHVEHVDNRGDGSTVMILTDRRTHVARVAMNAFGRPIAGAGEDDGLHVKAVACTTECWVRI